MLETSSKPKLGPSFGFVLNKNKHQINAALNTMAYQKESFLTKKSAKTTFTDLFTEATKGMFFLQQESKWLKTCLGHEYKITSHNKTRSGKKKADNKAEEVKSEYKQKQNIIPDSVWSEVRGKYDPYVHFKYVDNCQDCSCMAKKISTLNKINILDFFSQLTKSLNETNQEIFYREITKHILKI